jgi:hypothetical protein
VGVHSPCAKAALSSALPRLGRGARRNILTAMEGAAKIVLIGAAALALAGLALLALSRLGVTDLPGTFRWRSRNGNATVYAPVGLMILLSVVGTILLNLFFRR